MPSVIFICTGNLHRSPMAEYLFRNKMESGWEIASAGTYTRAGLPTNTEVITVLKTYGIDASDHQAKVATHTLLSKYNLILCLARNHKEILTLEFSDLADRIYLLSEMVGLTADVEDPIGAPLSAYQITAKEIDTYLTRGLDQITNLAK